MFRILKCLKYTVIVLFVYNLLSLSGALAAYEKHHYPASSLSVINYSRGLLSSIVDEGFRGSWVIDPENKHKMEQKVKKVLGPFELLANVKIGSEAREVKKTLGTPKEIRLNGRIWVYGKPESNGTYSDLLQVFFNETREKVIGIVSFNPKDLDEQFGVKIGDPIEKMTSIYNEPVDEKDFIEDPDNKDYLGLYYLYPRSGVGFLLGQDKEKNNLLVQGVLVVGKQ